MKKILIGIICLCFFQPITAQVIQHQISDDGHVHIPLQFGFPYYGRIFTDSYMFSNGVVGFGSVNNHWCCSGHDLANARGYQFDFSIMPLQTDLINYGQGRFLTEGTPQYQRYKWENISEYGRPQNLNTFGVEIRPDGFVGMYYEKVNISPYRPITIGMTGDTSKGEYTQYYHGAGFTSNEAVSYITQGNLCITNPLSSPSCPNYQEAYTAQQCAISPLYSPSCSGYEQAYFAQQCSLNPLYDRLCQGYAEAYLAQQCSISQLYSTQCSGYQDAYYAQQCSLNGLYDRHCPNYAEAYSLANIVATPTVTVSAPTVQVSTTGTVSIETPVVSDPVVNEVITRPQVNNVPIQQNTTSSPTSVTTQAEPKAEKKAESKQVATVKKPEIKNEVSAEAPKIVAPVHEYKAPIILDLAYMQMVKKPIKDNNRAMYNLIMNSQHKHEEMVDEQYRR